MTLLAEVVACLDAAASRHAMIGATAMAVLGATRSTLDLDILTTDRSVLNRPFWRLLESPDVTVDIRIGDIQDPLVGVVRFTRDGDRPVDVIVGEAPWQESVISDASVRHVADVEVPIVDEAGLVLLKLYAGGPQDRWDIEQILGIVADPGGVREDVGNRLTGLPARCRNLWQLITQPPVDD